MTAVVVGRIGRTFPPPREIITPVVVLCALEAWDFFSEHGRDCLEAMLQARIAARVHGGMEWLGIPHHGEINERITRLWLTRRNRLGRNVAMRLALRLDLEESRG